MNQEAKWLAEIKELQQKVVAADQEREQAYTSAANWRSLYETEAKQRRLEANLARQALDSLKAQLQDLSRTASLSDRATAVQAEIAQVTSLEALQSRLIQALVECDRLSQCLRDEQSAHDNTRRSLTTALGDAIDQLNQERSQHLANLNNAHSPNEAAAPVEKAAVRPELKIPSFGPPPTDQAQSPS
jgi:chromosome segregation ATPase